MNDILLVCLSECVVIYPCNILCREDVAKFFIKFFKLKIILYKLFLNRQFEYDCAVNECTGNRPTDIAKLAVIKHIICN